MPDEVQLAARPRSMQTVRSLPLSAAGFALAALIMMSLAEAYLRRWPPADLHPFLGDAAPLAGPFAPHPDFGVAYRSFAAFQEDNRDALQEFGLLDGKMDRRPIWAFFGNSFVQADGMLADQARLQLPEKRVFALGRNERLEVRLAQIELLLSNGLKPERIFITLVPVDLLGIGPQPIDTIAVNSHGAMTYHLRRSGWPTLDRLVDHCRLAFTAWVRSGRAAGDPTFRGRGLYERVPPRVLSDLRRIFGHLSGVLEGHGVAATVIFIPTWEQVVGSKGDRFQDTLGDLMRELGFDVLDPRAKFLTASPTGRAGLYIADKHLSLAGNILLLRELVRHVEPGRVPSGELQASPRP